MLWSNSQIEGNRSIVWQIHIQKDDEGRFTEVERDECIWCAAGPHELSFYKKEGIWSSLEKPQSKSIFHSYEKHGEFGTSAE